ncbi:MAG: hypothetical protein PVS3B3_19920 [Ktedonobacteraceae bacterium]
MSKRNEILKIAILMELIVGKTIVVREMYTSLPAGVMYIKMVETPRCTIMYSRSSKKPNPEVFSIVALKPEIIC